MHVACTQNKEIRKAFIEVTMYNITGPTNVKFLWPLKNVILLSATSITWHMYGVQHCAYNYYKSS